MVIIPTETDKDIQLGYLQIYSGAMIGSQPSSEAGKAAES
jgi:hypothetical protein